MSTTHKALFVSDIHFPRHSPRHVNLLMKVVKAWKPDSIDLLGDIDDADSTGRWAEGTPDAIVGIGEGGVKETTQLFADLREERKDALIRMHDGNHGWTRHRQYLEKKAPALMDMIDADKLYEYSKHGVEWHDYDKPPVKLFDTGTLYGHHGESISKHAGESVRNDCLNWGVSLIRGHSHRQGVYKKSYPMTGQEIRGFEIGHLTDISQMTYTVNHDWQAGFAVGYIDDTGDHIQLIEIMDNTCYVDGKRFVA